MAERDQCLLLELKFQRSPIVALLTPCACPSLTEIVDIDHSLGKGLRSLLR